jgi:TonB family protein
MPKDVRFWRNVVMIALAHVAAVVGLMRWSSQAKSAPSQSIVWMDGGAGEGAPAQPPATTAIPAPPESPAPLPEAEATPADEPDEKDSMILTTARSEIQLPAATPRATPSATPTPKPTPLIKATPKPTPKATPRPKRKETPKPKPKAKPTPTPKKLVVAKASAKPTPKETPEADEAEQIEREAEKEEVVKPPPEKSKMPNNEAAPKKVIVAAGARGKDPSASGGGHGGGSGGESQFGWYGSMLHDRFHGEWDQPNSSLTPGSKLSVLVKIRIEKDGRVSNFEIVKPSGNAAVDESVAAVAKRVTQVDPLPAGLGNSDHYDVKINFELSSAP